MPDIYKKLLTNQIVCGIILIGRNIYRAIKIYVNQYSICGIFVGFAARRLKIKADGSTRSEYSSIVLPELQSTMSQVNLRNTSRGKSR